MSSNPWHPASYLIPSPPASRIAGFLPGLLLELALLRGGALMAGKTQLKFEEVQARLEHGLHLPVNCLPIAHFNRRTRARFGPQRIGEQCGRTELTGRS